MLQIWVTIAMFFLPESPVWLIEKERIDEAESAMKMVAKLNRRELIWDKKLYSKKIELVEGFIIKVENLPDKTSQSDFDTFL